MKNEYRISGGSAGLMYGVALVFDGISLIPVIGSIVPVFGSLTFWLWFKMKGVDFNSSKRFVTSISATLVEVVPVVNVLPAWTLATFLIIQEVRAEDLLNMQTQKNKRSQTAKNRARQVESSANNMEQANLKQREVQIEQSYIAEQATSPDDEAINENRLKNRVPLQDVKVPDTVRRIGRIDYQVNPHFGSTESQQSRIKEQKNAT